MAFKEVSVDSGERKEAEFYPYKTMEKGFTIEGFLKHKSNKPDLQDNGKPKFDINGNPKQKQFYFIDHPDWEKCKGLYGCGKLNYLMSKVSVGDYIRFTYMGKETVAGYESQLHQMKLEVDEERSNQKVENPEKVITDDDIPF